MTLSRILQCVTAENVPSAVGCRAGHGVLDLKSFSLWIIDANIKPPAETSDGQQWKVFVFCFFFCNLAAASSSDKVQRFTPLAGVSSPEPVQRGQRSGSGSSCHTVGHTIAQHLGPVSCKKPCYCTKTKEVWDQGRYITGVNWTLSLQCTWILPVHPWVHHADCRGPWLQASVYSGPHRMLRFLIRFFSSTLAA